MSDREEPTPALLEIGVIKKSKMQKLEYLMTLEEGMARVLEGTSTTKEKNK